MLRYHNITTDDMLNGEGLRTVLWLSGCEHHCIGCHNPETWDPDIGLPVDDTVINEVIEKLKPDYISGLTLSGGDPLYIHNRDYLLPILKEIKSKMGNKTIWLYTGYTWDDLIYSDDYTTYSILELIDVLVDGKYYDDLNSADYHWAGSTNQRVIDVKKSLKSEKVVLYDNDYNDKGEK